MDLQIFNTPDDFEIRTLTIAGEPWFIASDVCRALDIGNSSMAASRLEPEDHTIISTEGIPGAKNPQMRIVSESGLYCMVLGSRKPEARQFQRWVVREVLPSIRKTGSYTAATVPELSRLDLAKMILDAETRNEEKDRIIESQKPAVEFVADLVDTKSLTTLSDAAKEFGYGPKEFAGMLEARKIIFKRTNGGPWLAKQEHLDAGRFSTKIHMVRDWAKPTTCLTGKGLVWLRSVLKPAASTFDGLFGEMVA